MVIRISNPSLVILCGQAGSGKTTFARRHFPETAIVSSDRCRAMIADDEANIWVSRDAFALFHEIIETRLRHRRLAVADSTALRPDARRTLRGIARRWEVPVTVILFDVPAQTSMRWDERRSRKVGHPVISHQWQRFQQALRDVPAEGYDQVIILGEEDLAKTRVELVRTPARNAAAKPGVNRES